MVAAVAVLLLGAVPAWSHSELERSDPPNGGMVPPGRTFVTLWFGEPVSVGAAAFDLRKADGTSVRVSVSSSGEGDTVLRLGTPPLGPTTYELDWRVLSLADGHPSSGSLAFGAGSRPDVLPAGGSGLPGAPLLVLRWLDLSGLLLAVGALAVSGRVLGTLGESGAGVRRGTRLIGGVAVLATAYAGVLTPFVRTQRPGNALGVWLEETWSTLTASPWGHVWMAREAAVVVAAAAMWSWALSRGAATGRMRVAVSGLAVAAVLEAWAGHASALPGAAWLTAVVSAAHVLAAGVWAGGLLVLALTLLPVTRRQPDLRGPLLSSVWRAYSPRAAAASIVLLATGLYAAGRHVPDLGSLGATWYGAGVVLKLGLVAVALGLAGLNTLLVHPGLAGRARRLLGRPAGWAPVSLRQFSTVVAAEAAVLLAAVAAAALLTSVPTAREVVAAEQVTPVHRANVDGLFVTFEGLPGGPDRTRLVVRARATVLPPPAWVSGVETRLTGPGGDQSAVRLDRVEKGRYEGDTDALAPGGWTVEVVVHRDGLPDAVSLAEWTVDSRPAPSWGPLQLLTAGTAVLLLSGLLGAVVLARRHRDGTVVRPRLPVSERDRSMR